MLITKLVISFFVGGIFIALLSVFAEKYSKIGGIIISIPGTLPLGILFIGWTQGKSVAIEAMSIVPLATALLLVFTITYVYSSKISSTTRYSIILANAISIAVWLALAIMAGYAEMNDPFVGILIYLAVFILSLFLLRNKITKGEASERLRVTSRRLVWRAVFAGSVVFTSVLLAKISNPLLGGAFAVFPAAYLSSFNMIQISQGNRFLSRVARTVPYGSLSLLLYVVLAHFLFDLGLLIGTVCSLAIIIALTVLANIIAGRATAPSS